ncbi:MAG: hypothetical protein IJO48_06170 [Clostridia bacterium]|nr:hypothetical protein [Clostridia bacterium]
MKYCILNDSKYCDDCGECNVCDLDPKKICDNCCKCIDNGDKEYNEINVTEYLNRTNKDSDATLSDDMSLEGLYRDPSDYLEDVDPAIMAEWEAQLHDLNNTSKLKLKTISASSKRRR